MACPMPTHTLLAISNVLIATAVTGFCSTASAQILPVASETFEYPTPGSFHNLNGGTGFAAPWSVTGGGAGVELFDTTAAVPFPGSDGVGGFAGQGTLNGEAYRLIDGLSHPDIADAAGNVGNDGATVWISFTSMHYVGAVGGHWGGLSLMDQGVEAMFLGAPHATNMWGFGDYGVNGVWTQTVAGTNDTVTARLVYRIDHRAGMDRMRIWVDPVSAHPNTAADLDMVIGDLHWNEIRLASGGFNNDGFYWDNIVIEKGNESGPVGTSYCGPAIANLTGLPAEISATGEVTVASNDVTLHVSSLPANSFGVFLVSQATDLVPAAGGGQGTLCLGGSIGRYSGPGQIQNSGAAGEISLPLDLRQTPQPTGFVSVLASETWYYQAWYRDAVGGVATSNFTDGLEIAFQ